MTRWVALTPPCGTPESWEAKGEALCAIGNARAIQALVTLQHSG